MSYKLKPSHSFSVLMLSYTVSNMVYNDQIEMFFHIAVTEMSKVLI